MEPWSVVADSFHFDNEQDPDPHQSEKSNQDQDPHQGDTDPQHCLKYKIHSLGTDFECYHVPYASIQLWSDLSTPTGLMAAFSKTKLRKALQVIGRDKSVSCYYPVV